ncbi:hypothetical protein [Vibrio ouci]|uniref:Uncharacterized protein n=1 Tax=Vibrio ouci TaxID=2499078 RepID=A0A4Y8WGN9_9VIBR|nr:hypothetical protein [Vibrio ouci]TFH91765.1 hypothetical protein ELS82_09670 [Vibrio ouci]
MGRVGSKIRMRIIRKQLQKYLRSKKEPFKIGDYYKKCEFDKLKSIKNIYYANIEKTFLKDISIEFKKGFAVDSEMPDIQGISFGLEQTEVSPFFRHKRKGDTYRIYNRVMRESQRVIEFDTFSFNYIELPMFFKKLRVQQRSNLIENIVGAVQEKSEKFKKYKHFKHNGLWIEYPYNISFPKEGLLGYFMQDEIYNALIDSPFDFFVLGNAESVLFITKETLIEAKPEVKTCDTFLLTDRDDFTQAYFKSKKAQQVIMLGSALPDSIPVSKDILMAHIYKMELQFPKEKERQVQASLYSDDLKLALDELTVADGIYKLTFTQDGLYGVVQTDFKKQFEFSFGNIPFEAGEQISLHASQYDDSDKQKLLTGTKRLILDYGNRIVVLTTPCISLFHNANVSILQQKGTEDAFPVA